MSGFCERCNLNSLTVKNLKDSDSIERTTSSVSYTHLNAAVISVSLIFREMYGTNSWSRGINELPARGIRIWLRCLNCPRIGRAGLIRWLCGKISSSIAINAAEPKTVIVPFVGKRSLYPGIHITIRKDAVPAAGIPLYSKPWGAPGIFAEFRGCRPDTDDLHEQFHA